ncbi:MAG TPA: M14 family zinc carboxypeptidase [Ilumatobacteraceae bacterium]
MVRRGHILGALVVGIGVVTSACSSDTGPSAVADSTPFSSPSVATDPAGTTSVTLATTSTTSPPDPTTSSTSTSSTSTTSTSTLPDAVIETRVIGQSVQGRDITAYHLGTPGGRPVLLIGVIHGNEPKGELITRKIRTMPIPPDIDLWVIDSINPDGLAANTRENANGVDLNRNVSWNWNYIPKSDDNDQYSGEAPADQPETQALESFVNEIQPAITIFWHQDANRVSPGGARKEISLRFAEIVGLSTASTPCSAGCTGTATQFVNHAVAGGSAFIVELPGNDEVTEAMVDLHAEATLEVITM